MLKTIESLKFYGTASLISIVDAPNNSPMLAEYFL